MNLAEFPHSEISGSKDICSSPKLIAAYHVFHRLLVPRHSPCALFSLTVFLLWFSICQQDFLPLSEIVSHNISVMLLTTNKWFLKILFRSYYSVFKVHSGMWQFLLPHSSSLFFNKEMVGQNGLEPSTSRLSVVCSSQLSYWPTLVEIKGFEPLTPCLQSRCSPSWATPPYLFLQRYIFYNICRRMSIGFLIFIKNPQN